MAPGFVGKIAVPQGGGGIILPHFVGSFLGWLGGCSHSASLPTEPHCPCWSSWAEMPTGSQILSLGTWDFGFGSWLRLNSLEGKEELGVGQ